MKKLCIMITVAIAMTFVACKDSCCKTVPASANSDTQAFNLDTTSLKPGTVFYQCDMHPEILSDQTGNCPKCGMDLSERAKKN